MDETKIYDSSIFKEALIGDLLKEVIAVLSEKGYDPINQIVGYLMSGDPGYISSYKEARKKILSINRSDLLGFLVKIQVQIGSSLHRFLSSFGLCLLKRLKKGFLKN